MTLNLIQTPCPAHQSLSTLPYIVGLNIPPLKFQFNGIKSKTVVILNVFSIAIIFKVPLKLMTITPSKYVLSSSYLI